jgi:hypothetical protein
LDRLVQRSRSSLPVDQAVLTVTSRDDGSWARRGVRLCRLAGLTGRAEPEAIGELDIEF